MRAIVILSFITLITFSDKNSASIRQTQIRMHEEATTSKCSMCLNIFFFFLKLVYTKEDTWHKTNNDNIFSHIQSVQLIQRACVGALILYICVLNKYVTPFRCYHQYQAHSSHVVHRKSNWKFRHTLSSLGKWNAVPKKDTNSIDKLQNKSM